MRAKLVLAVLVAAIGSAGWAAQASAFVYWSDVSAATIGRANLDGSAANQSFITGVSNTAGVAVDGQHVYWANATSGTIGQANLDGTGANQSFITGANNPSGMAVDGQHIYWTNLTNHTIGRANLDGTVVNQSFITGANNPAGVAVDAQHIYWTNTTSGTIRRANLDGTAANQSFITGAGGPFGVAVDGGPPGTATPSAASLAFGSQPLDSLSAAQALTVTNTGHGVLQIARAQVTTGAIDDFLITADSCSAASLPINARCAIDVRFAPSVTAQRSATLTLASNDTAGPLQIPLAGTATSCPKDRPALRAHPVPQDRPALRAHPAPRVRPARTG